jgi:hypothetical protein
MQVQEFYLNDPVRIIADDAFYRGETGKVVAILPNAANYGHRYVVQPDYYHPLCKFNSMYRQDELEPHYPVKDGEAPQPRHREPTLEPTSDEKGSPR